MAITPEYLQEVAEAAEDLITANNKYILDRIAKRMNALFVAEGDVKFIPASVHDLAKLKSAGYLQEEIEEELQKRLPGLERELNKAFKDATKELAKQTQQFTESIVDAEKAMGKMKNIKVPNFPDVDNLDKYIPRDLNLTRQEIERIEAAYKRTKGEIKNLTATMPKEGYNSYIDACDAAYWKIRSGVSPDTAISEALDELTEKGVTCIEYNTGRKDRIEVAVGRAVRTGINQMTADVTLTRCAEMGVSHVLVSQHLGARITKKEDYTNHAHWQGKVYYLDWDREELKKYRVAADQDEENAMNNVLSDIKEEMMESYASYPDFIEECGYKKMLGICGINCRHTFSPFYAGINKNTYKAFDENKNKDRVKQEQKQRAMERDIMQDKLRLEEQKTLKELEPSEEVINKIRDLKNEIYDKMEEYNEFCKANKLPNHTNRMRIRKIDPKTVQATDKVIKKKTEEIVKKVKKDAKFEPKKLNEISFVKEATEFSNINLQEIKKIELAEQITEIIRTEKIIQARKVLNVKAENIYISEKLLEVNTINLSKFKTLVKDLEEVKKKMNIKKWNTQIVLTDITELGKAEGAYNPFTDILYLGIGEKRYNKYWDFDEIFTICHELFHWYDAEQRRNSGLIIDNNYMIKLRKKSKKIIEKLIKKGYDVATITDYATQTYMEKKYEEVYTEWRAYQKMIEWGLKE